jgi:hypothetical protein
MKETVVNKNQKYRFYQPKIVCIEAIEPII